MRLWLAVALVFAAGCRDFEGAVNAAAARLDAGTFDAGALDAGTLDAGTLDAGTLDAGTLDAGTLDAGTLDGGEPDAGPRCRILRQVSLQASLGLGNSSAGVAVASIGAEFLLAVPTPSGQTSLAKYQPGGALLHQTSLGCGGACLGARVAKVPAQSDRLAFVGWTGSGVQAYPLQRSDLGNLGNAGASCQGAPPSIAGADVTLALDGGRLVAVGCFLGFELSVENARGATGANSREVRVARSAGAGWFAYTTSTGFTAAPLDLAVATFPNLPLINTPLIGLALEVAPNGLGYVAGVVPIDRLAVYRFDGVDGGRPLDVGIVFAKASAAAPVGLAASDAGLLVAYEAGAGGAYAFYLGSDGTQEQEFLLAATGSRPQVAWSAEASLFVVTFLDPTTNAPSLVEVSCREP